MNVIYLRASKGENYQDTSHQLSSCKSFAEAHNISIDEVIEDTGISAYSKDWQEREGFSKVMALAEKGLENLIVFESSRISRKFISGQNIIDYLTQHNVKVWSVADNCQLNENELSQLWNSFRYFMNQKASKETSQRVKSKKREMREQGKFLGHPILTGFKVENGVEVIDEETRYIIEEMFDDYVHYRTKYCLEKYNISSHQILMQKLRNKKYIKIVGEAKFNQVQNIIQNRRCNTTTRNLNRSNILFESLLYHKYCGSKLVIYRDRKGNPIFRCRTCKGNPNVEVKKSFTGIKLMQNLEHDILEVLDNLNHDALAERYNSRCGKKKLILELKIKELNNLSKSKEKALILANTKLERYIMEDASDNMVKAVSDMIAKVKEELNDIQTELEQIQSELDTIINEENHQEELIGQVLNARDIYKNAPIDKKKAVLNLIVQRIDVSDIDDYDIYLNI